MPKLSYSSFWPRYVPPACADMAGRRLLYLAALELCLVLYVAYREWLGWLLLVAVAFLPLLSLLLSLPAMLTVRCTLRCPAEVPMGTPVRPELQTSCNLPAPPVRCRVLVRHGITGRQEQCLPGTRLPTDHCGVLALSAHKGWVYDYLGLWRLPLWRIQAQKLTVLPQELAPQKLPSLASCKATAWRAKPDGFAENHDLRLYRPGDDLRQIHWKLSSKTGKLIYREPLEASRKRMLLTLVLSGSPAQIDQKLGQLLWISRWLLKQELSHEVRCLTGRGIEAHLIATKQEQHAALCALLASPAGTGPMPDSIDGAWQYAIGGDCHEG